MRQVLVTILLATLTYSCNNSGKKEKEPVAKDSATIGPVDTAGIEPITHPPEVTDPTKTVKLTFSGYDEGDYAHLLFTETGTGTDYDFGHPGDNNLDNIPLVLKDDNASFGYKENKKMIGSKFVAEIIYKTVDTHDEDGQPKKAKGFRIISLKKDE